MAGPTGGKATTTTDFGSRNEGGTLKRRFSVSSVGNASAGMYWKCAVCSEARIRAVSTIGPDIRAVNTGAAERGIAQLVHQVGAAAAG